jgi:histidinol-phosphate/aromatic aminotransferase/cobyric acid decarboxylase-like protein
MQPWVGPHWRQDSLIHQRAWVQHMALTRHIHVWVMTSWTKIWSCTGLRIGSVVAPTTQHAAAIKKKQVPWSVNSMALVFVSNVVQDTEYLTKTWEITPQWRAQLVHALQTRFPKWIVHGQAYLSWIWVDTQSIATAEQACVLAKQEGVPVRSGQPGYNMPTFIRIAVRAPAATAVLLNAWRDLK